MINLQMSCKDLEEQQCARILQTLNISQSYIMDSALSTTITMVKLWSGFPLENDTPYLALAGKIWGVFCEFCR